MTTIRFPGITRLDLPVERILNDASQAVLESVVVIGFGTDGEFYFSSSSADGGDVTWFLTRALHRLHQQADALEDEEQAAAPKTTGDVVPLALPDHVLISKPHAPAKSDTGANLWADACTGRLVLGNGCGQCLRCNREWWALIKHSHEAVAEGVIRITQTEVKASLARAPVVQPDIDASPTALQAHVDAWNAASAVGDEHRMKGLDIELRSLAFPPNVQVAIVGSAGSPKRKVIINAPAQPQA